MSEIAVIRSAWTEMQRSPESDIDFFSFIINIRPEVIQPYVLVVCKDGKPVSLIAGRLEDSRLDIKVGYKTVLHPRVRKLVVFNGGFMGDTTKPVIDAVVRRLLKSLREEKADLLIWNGIEWNTTLRQKVKEIPNFLCRDYVTRAVYHWQMTLPGCIEELFEKRMNKKHRYWAKRASRLLENDYPGDVRYASFSSPDDAGSFFSDVLRVAQKTYQWGLDVGFQGSEENRRRLMLEAEKGWFRGFILYLKGEPLAFWICTVYKGTVYLDYTGYDPEFGKYEIGTALLFRIIAELGRENIRQMDFGPGTAFYKERLADSSFEEGIVYAFALSLRGVCFNLLRTLMQLPVGLARNLLSRLGLEQRVKKMWRSCAALKRESAHLAKSSSRADASRTY